MEVIKTLPAYLEEYVKFFYTVKATSSENVNTAHRRLPDGTLDLVFNLGDAVLTSKDGINFYQMPRAALTGLHLNRQFIKYQGNVHLVGAVFKPGFAHFLVHDSLEYFTSCYLEASAIYGDKISGLMEQLTRMDAEEEKHTLLEQFLLQYIGKSSLKKRNELISSAVSQIHLANGNMVVKDLHKNSCMSESTFRRAFHEFVGMSPKNYSSIVRIKSFSKYFEKHRTSQIIISDKLGYTDQSHFNKDFRKIAGISPSVYFDLLSKIGTEFIHLI